MPASRDYMSNGYGMDPMARWDAPDGADSFATVKGAGVFPADRIPQPTLEHGVGMLRSEVTDTVILLRRQLNAGAWASDDPAAAVRATILELIAEYEDLAAAGRLRRWPRLIRAVARPIMAARGARRRTVRAGYPPERLVEDLAYWGSQVATMALRYRHGLDRDVRPEDGAGGSAGYLIRVLLARDTWLHRVDLAEASGITPEAGPHGAEIVRQAVRDVSADWSGPPVQLEISGPTGGRWLVGGADVSDDGAVAIVRSDSVSYLRHVTGQPGPPPEVRGDATTASAFLAVRIPSGHVQATR